MLCGSVHCCARLDIQDSTTIYTKLSDIFTTAPMLRTNVWACIGMFQCRNTKRRSRWKVRQVTIAILPTILIAQTPFAFEIRELTVKESDFWHSGSRN